MIIFDSLLGHKAGTNASVSCDSSSKGKKLIDEKTQSKETGTDEKLPDIKKKEVTTKRKSSVPDILGKLEKQGYDLKDKMDHATF